jgi:plastocyanin
MIPMRTRILIPILVLGLVACSAPADSNAPASEAAADALAVNLMDFMIDPSELEATGPTVTMDVTSDGPTPHNLTVRDEAGEVVMATADLSVGDTETITADLEPGDYTILCSLAGHESLGMSGTLTVTAP